MIEIRITREIGEYEPKFVGPFTMRQVVCVIIGGIFCFFIYNFTFPYMPVDVAGFFCCIPAFIAVLFGWVKPYGIKMEKFIQSVGVNLLLAPTNRPYRTRNVQEELIAVLEEAEDNGDKIKKEIKKAGNAAKKAKHKYTKRTTPEYYL